jgi:fermentation-respiration switch protein FrsA (DUF1100 family)
MMAAATCFSMTGVALAAGQAWDKTFPPSDKATVEKVSFKNRLDIALVGDMYLPRNMDRSKKYPAIVVGHPFGGVKEQTAGLYAQKMAERGLITLAFDVSFGGESGGTPRPIASPEIFVEDFSAAVDFIGTRPFVDRKRIGVIGICGSGGFAISAAQIDPRMKAIATVSMYDMGRERRQGFQDTTTQEERARKLEEIAGQRWVEFSGGKREMVIGAPESIDENSPAVAKEFYDYYRTPRGRHPRSTTMFTLTSSAPLMNFFPFVQIETISPRPLLFIVGENAHSRYFSEDAFNLAAEPKELYIVPGAGHVDLYDKPEYIPFDKLTSFFNEHLTRQ